MAVVADASIEALGATIRAEIQEVRQDLLKKVSEIIIEVKSGCEKKMKMLDEKQLQLVKLQLKGEMLQLRKEMTEQI